MTEATIRQALSQQKTAPPAKAEEAQPVKKALTGDETLLGLLARSKDWQNEYPELYKSLVSCYTGVIQDLIFAVEEYYRGLSPAELKNELTLLVRRYEEAENDRLKDEYAQKIQQAQVKGDREAMKQLLARFQKLLH